MSASARTRARPLISAGSSGGEGYFSSRYSRMASDWNSVVPSSSTSAGSAICGLMRRYSGSRCALASRSTKITSAGIFFRLSAMRTRKLASDRQNEKNFMGLSGFFFPSPTRGEGKKAVARMERSEIRDCRTRIDFPGLRYAPSGLRGFPQRATASGPDGLLPIRQMHRAGAAGRMGSNIVGGDGGDRRRRFRGLLLRGNIVQHRRQPALGLGHAHALARSVVLDLLALDLADAEIEAFGVADIETRHRRARPHRTALGQLDAGGVLRIEQTEQRRLLGVIGLRGIAGRRADTGILLQDQLIGRQRLVRRIAPEFLADALVHPLGKGLGE